MNFQALAWWSIWPLALFWMAAPQKNFRDLKSFFLLLCNLIPCHNKLSIPGMLEFLAYVYIYIALFGMPAPEKTFRDLNSFFFPSPPLQSNTTPK